MADADTTERELDTELDTQMATEDIDQGDAEETDDLEERLVAEGEIAGDRKSVV